MPIEEVQQFLGHVNINTTMVYAQVSRANLKRATDGALCESGFPLSFFEGENMTEIRAGPRLEVLFFDIKIRREGEKT